MTSHVYLNCWVVITWWFKALYQHLNMKWGQWSWWPWN